MQFGIKPDAMEKHNFLFEYYALNYNELSEQMQNLVDEAKNATASSYAPFSHFSVGAAVLLENGTIIRGSNQENVAYPSGLCAERVAMFAANANHPNVAPVALAIAAKNNGEFTDTPVTPCGACRQVLLETEQRFSKPIRIVLYGKQKIFMVESVANMMPLSFEL